MAGRPGGSSLAPAEPAGHCDRVGGQPAFGAARARAARRDVPRAAPAARAGPLDPTAARRHHPCVANHRGRVAPLPRAFARGHDGRRLGRGRSGTHRRRGGAHLVPTTDQSGRDGPAVGDGMARRSPAGRHAEVGAGGGRDRRSRPRDDPPSRRTRCRRPGRSARPHTPRAGHDPCVRGVGGDAHERPGRALGRGDGGTRAARRPVRRVERRRHRDRITRGAQLDAPAPRNEAIPAVGVVGATGSGEHDRPPRSARGPPRPRAMVAGVAGTHDRRTRLPTRQGAEHSPTSRRSLVCTWRSSSSWPTADLRRATSPSVSPGIRDRRCRSRSGSTSAGDLRPASVSSHTRRASNAAGMPAGGGRVVGLGPPSAGRERDTRGLHPRDPPSRTPAGAGPGRVGRARVRNRQRPVPSRDPREGGRPSDGRRCPRCPPAIPSRNPSDDRWSHGRDRRARAEADPATDQSVATP